ncbi:MAG: hypothetical protein F4Z25_11100 [Chloroflexi bacterium]|nr:hypothetical protein [Chloroflexota bacterium]
MDFAWSDEQNEFRAQIREFLEDAWPEEVRSADRLSRRAPEHAGAIKRFKDMVAERGWYSIGWPEEYGGSGDLTAVERFILSDEASRVGAPLSLYNVNIMGPLIIKHGSPWMKSELLPKIRDGEIDFTLGFTEPETGSDLANLSTAAYRDGDEYVINGSKMYGRPGPGDIMYLAVRTDPDAPLRDGISLLFVEHGREGFTVASMPTLDGGEVGATFYDDVRVPADHLLGVENRGWDYVREALDLDRTSGIPYGHMPLMRDNLIAFIKETKVDGRPLAEDPWVRDRIAQLVIDQEAGDVLQGMTASKIATGMKLRTESSVLKIFMTELERRMGEFGTEIVGPLGSLQPASGEAPLEGQIWATHKFNVAITIAGGSSEIQRNIIALQGLGLPRD